MSKAAYIGVDGTARKVKKLYIGVDGIARKVKKGYIGVDGVARLFFVSQYFEYTGNYTEQEVTIDGVPHILYTLTSSGTLKCSDSQYWMCGGGGKGGGRSSYSSGGGGGGGYVDSGDLLSGEYAVVIGPRGSATSIGDKTAEGGAAGGTGAGTGGNGGSGGGAPGQRYSDGTAGTGAGVSTYPFGLTELKAHSAGGGSGEYWDQEYRALWTGGNGGSNGSAGKKGTEVDYYDYDQLTPGNGGTYGGGKGGTATTKGNAATFYGGGGGGSGDKVNSDGTNGNTTSGGGNGYQGVAYILQQA